ncbi:AMP-binding protein [Psychrobacillus sp. BL-248-WT-3]|uniref:class I adenylate-forming enzyme family protein n=1 Tax=Psychrobacillus sp. BL-248-WT-3 TaxID=2725306 RepID=UPI00146F2E42|nr:AMP-binding protein [Psychrobacillus sp. BL-248-WT-3]NME06954.1 long-chain fatty acid--CoA ligase [Psychrobacillus sp. BL-248-WT-3]
MQLVLQNKPIHSYIEQHAKTTPEKTAINFYGKEISYGQLWDSIKRVASFLTEQGITKGDTVALFLQNCPQYVIAFFAIQKIGAIAGPCNPMFKEWELKYQLNDLEAKAIFTTPDLYEVFYKIEEETKVESKIITSYKDYLPDVPCPDFPEQIIENQWEDTYDWSSILQNEQYNKDVNATIDMAEDVSLIIYTSGTTGSPKGAMLTFQNSEFQAACVAKNFGFTKEDTYISVMPIFHIAGKLVGLLSAMMVGASVVLLTRFDPKGMLQAYEQYNATVLYTTTPMNIQMLREPSIKGIDFSNLKIDIVTSFGVQLSKEISDEWESITGKPLMEFAYGMSETHTGNTMTPPDDIRYGSVGKPTFDTDIKVVDFEDYHLDKAVGEQGMILVKGPSVFKGYKGKEEETQKSFFHDYFITGDIGTFDEDGFLYFLGRVKEMIKCSGYSVYPEEVEKMLSQHEKINQVAVIGVPDPVRGESVKAFIVLEEGVQSTEEEITEWAKERMSAYKYPREVEFINELPKTSSGKILRRLLKKENE